MTGLPCPDAAARVLRNSNIFGAEMWRRTVWRRFPEAVDQLTDIFLEAGLLVRLPATDVAREKICQEGKKEESPVSDSGQGE